MKFLLDTNACIQLLRYPLTSAACRDYESKIGNNGQDRQNGKGPFQIIRKHYDDQRKDHRRTCQTG